MGKLGRDDMDFAFRPSRVSRTPRSLTEPWIGQTETSSHLSDSTRFFVHSSRIFFREPSAKQAFLGKGQKDIPNAKREKHVGIQSDHKRLVNKAYALSNSWPSLATRRRFEVWGYYWG